MRIALIANGFFPRAGGAEMVVHNLASEWTRSGHEVRIFAQASGMFGQNQPQAPPGAGYSVRSYRVLRGATRLGYHRVPWATCARVSLERALRDFRPACLSCHCAYPPGVLLSGIEVAAPYTITCHGRDITTLAWGDRRRYAIDRLLLAALNRCRKVVAISDSARSLIESLGVLPTHIIDIPNGVDADAFSAPAAWDLRGDLNLPPRARFILSVGREHEQKAFPTALRAFARLNARAPDVYYVLIGRGVERLAPLVGELKLTSRVRLSPPLSGERLVAAYQQATVFFSSSVFELFSLVILEAMAAGAPLVATNVEGNRDAIEQGENGILVAAGDEAGMAEALLELLASPNLRRSFSRNNREKALRYAWDRISERHLAAILS